MSPVQTALGDLTGSAILKLTTDYIYRGYTKSDGQPTIQANLDAFHSTGVSLGAWLSQVDFGGAQIEAYPYLGLRVRIGEDWRLNNSIAGYFYDAPVFEQDANYGEWTIQIGYRDRVSARVSAAPDAYGRGQTVLTYQADARHPLTDTLEATASLGYSTTRDILNYDNLYWNLGLTWFIHRHLTLDLRYYAVREINTRPHESASEDGLATLLVDTPLVFSVLLGY